MGGWLTTSVVAHRRERLRKWRLKHKHQPEVSMWQYLHVQLEVKRLSIASFYPIDHQPLVLNEEQALYNIRKLTELPHCLANSGRNEALKELLTDYQWLKACILSLPCKDIIHDFTPVIPTVPICRYTGHASWHSPVFRARRLVHLSSYIFFPFPRLSLILKRCYSF